jgi:hypothetical protein
MTRRLPPPSRRRFTDRGFDAPRSRGDSLPVPVAKRPKNHAFSQPERVADGSPAQHQHARAQGTAGTGHSGTAGKRGDGATIAVDPERTAQRASPGAALEDATGHPRATRWNVTTIAVGLERTANELRPGTPRGPAGGATDDAAGPSSERAVARAHRPADAATAVPGAPRTGLVGGVGQTRRTTRQSPPPSPPSLKPPARAASAGAGRICRGGPAGGVLARPGVRGARHWAAGIAGGVARNRMGLRKGVICA